MLKRICLLFAIAVLFSATICPQYALAESETLELLPEKAFWRGSPDGGAFVMLEENNGTFLFYSFVPDKKPSTQTYYDTPASIKQEGHSLVYYFTVEDGGCAVELLLTDANGDRVTVSLGKALHGEDQLTEGIYKGALPLNALYAGEELLFTGIRIEIHGGKLKVMVLDVMQDGDIPADVSEIESSEEPSAPAESEEESREESRETSSAPESENEASYRDSVFLPKDKTSLSKEEAALTAFLVTGISSVGLLLVVWFSYSLFRRSRPNL